MMWIVAAVSNATSYSCHRSRADQQDLGLAKCMINGDVLVLSKGDRSQSSGKLKFGN